jgi:6-phosphogluconolactonase
LAAALLLAGAVAAQPGPAESRDSKNLLRIYVGTYTGGESRGIYRFEVDAASGSAVAGPVLAGHSENPSFLVLHPNGRVLYAVNEVQSFVGRPTGAVSAFAFDRESGTLSLLNQQPSEGADPCHLAVDSVGRSVVVANYSGGSVAVLPLDAGGRLRPAARVRRLSGSGPNASRQRSPHAHGVLFDPSRRFLLTADLGADRIHVDRFDVKTGRLTPNEPDGVALEPGSGPRHLAWRPSGRVLYAINELRSTVTSLRWDGDRGALEALQTVSTLPEGFTGDNTAAEIAVSPDGRFVYASNRGDDSLAVFAADASGKLAPVDRVPSGGQTPRSFAIDPSGRWLVAANQGSGSVVVFRLDPVTGLPRPTGTTVEVPEPVSILFSPAHGAGKKAPVP